MMNVRVFYEKTGRARFISHLDMMRFMTRALKRSGLPVWYTEGYNRHIYTTFALPLSLGFESLCEFMDFRLLPDEYDLDQAARDLNACLTPDVRVARAAVPVLGPEAIRWADFRLTFLECGDPAGLEEALRRFCGQSSICVEKKTKRGVGTVDIAPLMTLLEAGSAPGSTTALLRLAAGGTMNINPNLALQEFWRQSGFAPGPVRVLRTRVLTENFADFA